MSTLNFTQKVRHYNVHNAWTHVTCVCPIWLCEFYHQFFNILWGTRIFHVHQVWHNNTYSYRSVTTCKDFSILLINNKLSFVCLRYMNDWWIFGMCVDPEALPVLWSSLFSHKLHNSEDYFCARWDQTSMESALSDGKRVVRPSKLCE